MTRIKHIDFITSIFSNLLEGERSELLDGTIEDSVTSVLIVSSSEDTVGDFLYWSVFGVQFLFSFCGRN